VVGGVSGNEGVVLSRDADDVVRKVQLTEESWFLVMTNLDSWTRHDARYEKAVSLMSSIDQKNITGTSIVENVLWQKGVLLSSSIFSAVISA